ncbi:MAG: type II toxin-antitoxin system VapC family toxin [Methylocystaceae bacterium]|nr:type II toxin-antitoxin system VapC family toxin [Methylocystaceae bacterium]
MIHLDTNVAIALLNGRPLQVRQRFDAARDAGTPIFLSAIVFHELMYGAANSLRRAENEEKIALFIASGSIQLIPFDEDAAATAAAIRAKLRRSGEPIGPYDLLIAAQALLRGATLITANTREFMRIPGLVVTDWAL